jgi:hypothetical protein
MTIHITSNGILSHDFAEACKIAIETAIPHSSPANRERGANRGLGGCAAEVEIGCF